VDSAQLLRLDAIETGDATFSMTSVVLPALHTAGCDSD